MDEAGNHHFQQTKTGTENQTSHVLTLKWVLTMRVHGHREGNITHWGLLWGGGTREGIIGGWGVWGGITLGEIPNVDDGERDAASHNGMCIPF